jgi:hypothetical protein
MNAAFEALWQLQVDHIKSHTGQDCCDGGDQQCLLHVTMSHMRPAPGETFYSRQLIGIDLAAGDSCQPHDGIKFCQNTACHLL